MSPVPEKTVSVTITDPKGVFIRLRHRPPGETLDVPVRTAEDLFLSERATRADGRTPTPSEIRARRLGIPLDQYEREEQARIAAEAAGRPPTTRLRVRKGKTLFVGGRTYLAGEVADVPHQLLDDVYLNELAERIDGPTPRKLDIVRKRAEAAGQPDALREARTREVIREELATARGGLL